MDQPVLYDVESRSRADLKTVGGRRYWEHPSTEVLCVCFDVPGVGELTWLPGDGPVPHFEVVGAHNDDSFDCHAWRRLGWPEPGRRIDMSHLAKRAGLRASLEELGEKIAGVSKDSEASRFTKSLSSIARPATVPAKVWKVMPDEERRRIGRQPDVTPEALHGRVVPYCQRDVRILVAAWPYLAQWADVDDDTMQANRAVNTRGICFDVALADALLDVDAIMCADALRLAGIDDPIEVRSTQRFAKHLRAAGHEGALPSCQAEVVLGLLKSPIPAVVALAEARLSLASIARGKLEAGLARSSAEGRLQDEHAYLAAHTWRFGGKGVQLQNIPWIDRRAQG